MKAKAKIKKTSPASPSSTPNNKDNCQELTGDATQLTSEASKKLSTRIAKPAKQSVAQKALAVNATKPAKVTVLTVASPKLKAKAKIILTRLTTLYPSPHSDLNAQDAWQLMVATILAAQCTDERVNKVTPALFARWPGPTQMAKANTADVEEVIRSTGLFRTKAKNLIENAKLLVNQFSGKIPCTMQDLTSLPGVARKTANIVLWGAFGLNLGMAVDTHVKRIAFRLGLTPNTNPEAVEKDLMALFPQASWGNLNNRMVWFGRDVCIARRPQCLSCPLEDLCEKQGLQ